MKSSCAEATPRVFRLLLADDHVTVREGLSSILGRRPDLDVIALAANGAEALDMWKRHRPDVTLIDLRMPILDGVEVITQVRAIDPQALFIVLTTYDSDQDVARAIKAGARGYLLKDAPTEELLSCIHEVCAGRSFIHPSLVTKLATEISSEPLTKREQEVLPLLADGKSNREIAAALYVGNATVKSHLRNIFGKLNVLSRTEAIAAATRRGIIQY